MLNMFFAIMFLVLHMDYYIGKIGLTVAHGPYSKAEIISRMRNGIIDDSYLVWTAGMADWLPIQNVINATIPTPLTPRKTRKKLYQPGASEPFRLSRSKLDNYLKCQRCFYLDRRLGIKPPSGPAFTLNIAVDELLKREFDTFRKNGKPHPLMVENSVNAVPWPDLVNHEEWRQNFTGIQHLHMSTNLELFGAVDDIWVNAQGELIVVDYKATSKAQAIQSTDDVGGWYGAYKRQLEIYVWLLRQQSDFTVSNDIYWVYANGDKTRDSFEGRLEFEMTIIKDRADDSWVEEVLGKAYECLQSDELPAPSQDCDFCKYLGAISNLE